MYRKEEYQVPIARGRWTAARIPFHVINILLKERLGINTTGHFGASSTDLLRKVGGCSVEENASTICVDPEQRSAHGVSEQQPPEYWAASDVWISSQENRDLMPFVSSAGFTGYVADPGLRALPRAFERSVPEGILLGFWESLLHARTKTCCFSNVSEVKAAIQDLVNAGTLATTAQTLDPMGFGYETLVEYDLAQHLDADGWYVSEACRDDRDRCIPLVLGEFDWNMREWINVSEAQRLPLAITSLGWVNGLLKAVPELDARNLSFLFYWWRPDDSFQAQDPKMVIFREEDLSIRQAQPTEKILWNRIAEVDRGEDIQYLYGKVTFSNREMNALLDTRKARLSAPGAPPADQVDYDLACQWLREFNETWSSWLPDKTNCEKGFYYNESKQECEGCALGKFTDEKGQTECRECQQGRFQSEPGKSECGLCTAGTFSIGGQEVCTNCERGTWQNQTGQSKCFECFGESPKMTTESASATSQEECLCPEDYFLPVGGMDVCEECPDGMICKVGSAMKNAVEGESLADCEARDTSTRYPCVDYGYMTRNSSVTTVWQCLSEEHCPGGGPATCATNRDTEEIACGSCRDNTYEDGAGCAECTEGSDVLPIVGLVVFGLVGLACLVYGVNRNMLMQSNASLMSIAIVSLMVAGIQTMGIFKQLGIKWTGAIEDLLGIVELFTFDLSILKVGCVIGSNPVSTYFLRQVIAPSSIPMIFLILLAKKRFLNPNTHVIPEGVNTIGTVFNIFYISICIAATAPFVCYKHPGGHARSMVSAASILCFSGEENNEHLYMVIVAILSLLAVPIPFLASSAYFVKKYPGYMRASGDKSSRHALQAMRFLYFRYQPNRYYYGMIFLLRSLTICFVPVVIQNDVALQVCVMCAILLIFCLVQQQLNPWRSMYANWMDGAISVCLVLMLVCGAMLVDLSAQQETVESLGLAAVLVIFVLCLGMLAFGTWKRLQPRPWYDMFICHHKAHAQAQARLLKTKLEAQKSCTIFIDSDNLTQLDELFDIVRCKVGRLVVYLTQSTLTRPWCAGEIVTATLAKQVEVRCIRTPSFVPPTQEQLGHIENFLAFADSSWSLKDYGIQFEMVVEAFGRLLGSEIPQLTLDKASGIQALESLAVILHDRKAQQQNQTVRGTKAKERIPKNTQAAVLIAVDASDVEACAAGLILASRIQEKVLVLVEQGALLTSEYQEETPRDYAEIAVSCHALIPLLSQGTLRSEAQTRMIVEVVRQQLEFKTEHGGTQHNANSFSAKLNPPPSVTHAAAASNRDVYVEGSSPAAANAQSGDGTPDVKVTTPGQGLQQPNVWPTTLKTPDDDIVRAASKRSSISDVSGASRTNLGQNQSTTTRSRQLAAQPTAIVPVFIDGFTFPGDTYYCEELQKMFGEEAGYIAYHMQAFFKNIALHFATGASDHSIETECNEVVLRVPQQKRVALPTARPNTARSPTPGHEVRTPTSAEQSKA